MCRGSHSVLVCSYMMVLAPFQLGAFCTNLWCVCARTHVHILGNLHVVVCIKLRRHHSLERQKNRHFVVIAC